MSGIRRIVLVIPQDTSAIIRALGADGLHNAFGKPITSAFRHSCQTPFLER